MLQDQILLYFTLHLELRQAGRQAASSQIPSLEWNVCVVEGRSRAPSGLVFHEAAAAARKKSWPFRGRLSG